MPELPEVETVALTLAPQIVGRRIKSVSILLPKSFQDPGSLQSTLKNATIERVWRRAKLLMVDVLTQDGSCLSLAFHLKMTGRFFVHPEGTAPLKHTRLIFDLDTKERLFFDDIRTFGWCRLCVAETLPEWSFWAALGPEPLDLDTTSLARHFQQTFANKKRAVKAALLDQGVVAGIGNIYADEALFHAAIRPDHPCGELPLDQLERLSASLQLKLRQSIDECGSSIRDYRDASGNAGAFQNNFGVYGHGGKPCRVCQAPLQTTRVAGRTTVFCPACQK